MNQTLSQFCCFDHFPNPTAHGGRKGASRKKYRFLIVVTYLLINVARAHNEHLKFNYQHKDYSKVVYLVVNPDISEYQYFVVFRTCYLMLLQSFDQYRNYYVMAFHRILECIRLLLSHRKKSMQTSIANCHCP